jgi:group I intron endonuclease
MITQSQINKFYQYPDIQEACSGVYGIISQVNSKIYIGSSNDIVKRKKEHLRSLRKGNHHCKYLQNAWNKYGESSFRFIVIEKITLLYNNDSYDKIRLCRFEQKYIDLFLPDKCLYNSMKVAGAYKSFSADINDRIKELPMSYMIEKATDILRQIEDPEYQIDETKFDVMYSEIKRLVEEKFRIEEPNIIENPNIPEANEAVLVKKKQATMWDVYYMYGILVSIVLTILIEPYDENAAMVFSIAGIFWSIRTLIRAYTL